MSGARAMTLPLGQQVSITTEIVRVTPSMAEKWLAKNIQNRHIRPGVVARLAQMMSDGEWLVTGEAIKFSHDGTLLDGQHRLSAIVESGCTVPLLVIKGLHPSTQDVMDTGVARKAADALTIHGFPNASKMAAAAKNILIYEGGLFYRDTKLQYVSHRAILDFVAGNTQLPVAVNRGSGAGRATDYQPSVLSMSAYVLAKVDDEAADEFFARLTDGAGLPIGHPILALRARMQELHRNRSVLSLEARTALIFRAWNAFRAGQKLTSLPMYHNGQLIACPTPK